MEERFGVVLVFFFGGDIEGLVLLSLFFLILVLFFLCYCRLGVLESRLVCLLLRVFGTYVCGKEGVKIGLGRGEIFMLVLVDFIGS